MELRQFVSLTSTVPNWLVNARGVRNLCLRGAFASDGIDIKMILQSCHPYKHIPSTSRPLLDVFACARVASIRTFVESYVRSFLCLRGAFASDGIDIKMILQSCLPPTRLTTIFNTGTFHQPNHPLLDVFACARVVSIRTFVGSYVRSFSSLLERIRSVYSPRSRSFALVGNFLRRHGIELNYTDISFDEQTIIGRFHLWTCCVDANM